MYKYAIMQEPGNLARANRKRWDHIFSPRHKRAGTITLFDAGEKEALGDFVHNRYLEAGNKQYAGHVFEWRTDRSFKWRADDGADPGTRGRRWSVVVTLRNGRNEHTTRFEAWRQDN